MVLLTRTLCRWWRRLAPCPETRGRATDEAEASGPGENSPDDLTAIRGIGIATQNRLYKAGITSYAQLAQASHEDVRARVGKLARGPDVENWIAQARELAGKEKS